MHRYLYVCTYTYVSICVYEYVSSIRSSICKWYLHRICYHEQEMYFSPSCDRKISCIFFAFFCEHNNVCVRCTQQHIRTHTQAHRMEHVHMLALAHTHTYEHTHKHTHLLSLTYTHYFSYSHAHTHAHPHT